MTAYYNEIDPDAAHILRALIADGIIAPGDVDTRSIKDVQPDDIKSYTQCHFFAGGGLWSVAARMAGWDDDRPIWTGSCPCQPFSQAGKGGGIDDPRHLWPDFFRLIRACRPAVVVGEQVAGQAGYGWFDGVRADLAREDYASRTVDIPACAVDAPHIRQRLYWVALGNPDDRRCERARLSNEPRREVSLAAGPDGCDAKRAKAGVTLGDAERAGLEGHAGHGDRSTGWALAHRPASEADGGGDLGHADRGGARAQSRDDGEVCGLPEAQREPELGAALPWRATGAGRNGSWWADHEWIACHDGKARRTQPGVSMLVDGLPGRVGLWRVAGNAITAPLAAEVIGALMDILDHKDLAA